MRLLKSILIAAALVLAAPAWADRGHGGKHHRDRHGWHDQRHHSHGKHHRHHRHHPRREFRTNYYYPAPVYPVYPAYAAPAPGVHIVVPNIYIPLR